jgi:aminocarboxymuconate-semialdehyde decarboxylase
MRAIRPSDWQKIATVGRTVDVHSHVYLPRYVDMMRSRTIVPRVVGEPGAERLLILPGEDTEDSTKGGRPIGPQYWDPEDKLGFMSMHRIHTSVISLANPWLDFLSSKEAIPLAKDINVDLSEMCEENSGEKHQLYGFGVLPFDRQGAVAELHRIAKLPRLRGVILGSRGIGNGLDDPDMLDVYKTLEEHDLTAFIHPHYGIGNEHFAGAGHSLFLAMGFPFETTVAVARLVLSGMLDKAKDVKLLLAHSGGTLPFLAGRLDSCVETDLHIADKLEHAPTTYLKRLYYDSLSYHTPALKCLFDFVGTDQVFFGTDHPFFPASEKDINEHDGKLYWKSTVSNYFALQPFETGVQKKILADNAERVLRLH